jgi:HK97 family phage major capsid protein
LQVAGWQPNVVVMHPNLWQAIRAERSLTENLYIAGNWAMPAPMTMWGMTVVLDPSVSQAVPMVLDASQVAILDRQEARVELGRSGNDFTDATVTLRAMIRVGLAVFSPSALVQVTIAT